MASDEIVLLIKRKCQLEFQLGDIDRKIVYLTYQKKNEKEELKINDAKEYFVRRFPEIHKSIIEYELKEKIKGKMYDDAIHLYYWIHNTLQRYIDDTEIRKHGGFKFCKGHRIHTHYGAALCLECGEGYCGTLFQHCCCYISREEESD